MSLLRSIPTPGSGRITLALLAVVPAVMAYPWRSSRDYWLLGIAAVVVIVLFGWWRGLHFTTILRRRLAVMGRRNTFVPDPSSAAETTVLLRVGAPVGDSDVLPLPLIARYLDRYGIRADKIRITCRDNASDASRRETWIGITISADDNYKIYVNPSGNGTTLPSGTAAASGNAAWNNSVTATLENGTNGFNGNSIFKIGTNYLTIVVTNSNSVNGSSSSTATNASGLLVYQVGSAVTINGHPIPEEGTLLPLFAAVGLYATFAWRRRQQVRA